MDPELLLRLDLLVGLVPRLILASLVVLELPLHPDLLAVLELRLHLEYLVDLVPPLRLGHLVGLVPRLILASLVVLELQ